MSIFKKSEKKLERKLRFFFYFRLREDIKSF